MTHGYAETAIPDAPTPAPRRRWRRPRFWIPLVAVLVLALTAAVVVVVVGRSNGDQAPTSDLPGWRHVFAEDFDTPVPLGSFPGTAYSDRWTGYEGQKDTSGAGTYSNERVVSVHDGKLDMHLRTEGGTPLVAAPIPLVTGAWGGLQYARLSVRFRADPVPGYKTAWLLWPDSDQWADGEVDFPEGRLDSSMYAANLCVGKPGVFDLKTDGLATYSDWHVATVEWTPAAVTFFLDGTQVARSGSSPTVPMHWVLQTETAYGAPPASASGHVLVDWVSAWTMTADNPQADAAPGRQCRIADQEQASSGQGSSGYGQGAGG